MPSKQSREQLCVLIYVFKYVHILLSFSYWNGVVPEDCARRNPTEKWKCYFGEHVYRTDSNSPKHSEQPAYGFFLVGSLSCMNVWFSFKNECICFVLCFWNNETRVFSILFHWMLVTKIILLSMLTSQILVPFLFPPLTFSASFLGSTFSVKINTSTKTWQIILFCSCEQALCSFFNGCMTQHS